MKSRKDAIYEAAMQCLKLRNAEVIDNYSKGGSVYFFDGEAALLMKELGYTIKYAKN